MIAFDLECSQGHIFEGWFNNTQSFEEQNTKKMVNCPYCNDTNIKKVISPVTMKTSSFPDKPEGVEPIDYERLAKEVVDYAHSKGVVVEAELGRLKGVEDNISVSEKDAILTDPDEAVRFVKETGCDSLAVAIGTSHGAYKFKSEPKLYFDRLEEIQKCIPDFPLVLHGASSVLQDLVKICKALVDFSKENVGLALRGGFLKEKLLGEQELQSLAKLPPRNVLLAQTVMTIAAPLTSFVAAANNVILKFLWLVEELKNKREQT